MKSIPCLIHFPTLLLLALLIDLPMAQGQSNDCGIALNGPLKGEPGNIQDNMFHSLAIDPRNENVVYAGTETSGIFKTTDGGATWTRLRLGLKCGPQRTGYPQIFDVAIDPTNTQILYAATVNGPGPADNPLYPSASAGVYKSTDGGMTWAQKTAGLTNTYALYVLIDATNTQRLYLGIGGLKSTFSQAPGVFYDGGIWSSDDGGDRWTPLALPVGVSSNVFIDMALRGSNQRTLYASGQLHGTDAPLAYGLIRSSDAGNSWSLVNPPGTTLYGFDSYLQDPNILYGHDSSPSRRVHKSTDGGTSWTQIPNASFFGVIRIHPRDSRIVYYVGRRGINKSTDGLLTSRATYTDEELTEAQQMLDIKIATSNPQVIWACAKGYYLYRSTDGGETFQRITVIRDLVYGNPLSQVIPSFPNGASNLMGLAMVHSGSGSATVSLTAYDQAGRPVNPGSGRNPVTLNFPAGRQLSRLTSELFSGAEVAAGWLRMLSDRFGVSGFFLNFDGGFRSMQGAIFTTRPSPSLVFPEAQNAEIVLVNPHPLLAADATLRWLSDAGKELASTSPIRIQPLGSLAGRVSDLFNPQLPGVGGYVQVSSTQPLAGAEQFSPGGGFLSALNALDIELGSRQLTAPQFVMGGDYKSSLTLVNLENSPTSVTISWNGNDGTPIGRGMVSNLPPLGRLVVNDAGFFGLNSARSAEGYLRVSSSPTLVAGAVRFGDAAESHFQTALPLPVYGRGEIIYPQVAEDNSYFTGVAVVNSGAQNAMVDIRVFNSQGEQVGFGRRVLAPNARFSELLSQINPRLPQLSSGYFKVSSDQPIMSFAVFGTRDLSSLAAIPGQ